MKTVAFDLKTLRVIKQNDGGDGGSEPYLFVTYFYGDRSTQSGGSVRTRVFETPYNSSFRSDIPNNLRKDAVVPVPVIQGRCRMRLDTDGNCFAGFVVVLMEEDQTNSAAINAARREVADAIAPAVDAVIRGNPAEGQPPYSWDTGDYYDVIYRIQDRVRSTIKSNTSWWERHTKDADDLVCVGLCMMMGTGRLVTRGAVRLPLGEGPDSTDERYELIYDVAVEPLFVPPTDVAVG